MRGAFSVMAAAAAAVMVAAWRRVHRDGVEARLADRDARERARARPPARPADETHRTAPTGAREPEIETRRVEPQRVERSAAASPATIRIVRRGSEPADSIRIVRRRAEPAEPIPVTRGSAGKPPEPAGPEAERAEPARAESSRTETGEPVHAPPFPAEAPERGRAEPPVPPTAWAGGSAPGPARVPRPMYWPAFLALAVVWAAWGAISSPLLIFGGIAVFAAALTLWIREMIRVYE